MTTRLTNCLQKPFVKEVSVDAAKQEMTIRVDVGRGTRFHHPWAPGEHKVHDTEIKRLRRLNSFQHRCVLEVRVPKLTLPDGNAEAEPDWVGSFRDSP